MLRQFASPNADGSWETGAFSLLNHKEYNQNGQSMVMIDKYHGMVIREYEKNGYDDSDFYAVVWDEEKQAPRHIQYATTRAWTYPCGCVVDATPEVLEKLKGWQARHTVAWAKYYDQESKYIPSVGKTVRSKTTKGKAKGKQGVVTWIGDSGYGHSVRFVTDSGEAVFAPVDRIEVWCDSDEIWYRVAGWSNTLKCWSVPKEILPYPEI